MIKVRSDLQLLPTLFLAFSFTPAFGAEPTYVGVWARSPKDCKPYPTGTRNEDNFKITRKTARGHEWSCDIERIVPEGPGWLARLSCAAEGTEYVRTVRWQPALNGRLRETEKGRSHDLVRCLDSEFGGD